jgi:hypothetical protein
MDADLGSLGWFLLAGLVIPGAFLVAALGSPTDRQLRRWASVAGVRLTPATEPVVRRRLGRGRRFRSVAAFPFWWIGMAPVVFGPNFALRHAGYAPAVGAYLLGAVVAELTTAAPPAAPGPRRAELSPRSAETYRPTWLRWAPAALVATAVAQVALGAVLDADLGATAVPLAVSVAVVGSAELAARRIADRPQRAGDVDGVAVDDALRATAVSLTSCTSLLGAIGAATSATGVLLDDGAGLAGWLALPWLLSLYGVAVGALTVVVRQENLGYWRRVRQPPAVAA